MRPGSREAVLYRVLDISIIQTATFQNISGTLVYSNCNWCWVSVLIVPRRECLYSKKSNVPIFPISKWFSTILCIVKSASNFKKIFPSKFAWLTYSLLYYICCFQTTIHRYPKHDRSTQFKNSFASLWPELFQKLSYKPFFDNIAGYNLTLSTQYLKKAMSIIIYMKYPPSFKNICKGTNF